MNKIRWLFGIPNALTVADIAFSLRVARSTVYRWLDNGWLKPLSRVSEAGGVMVSRATIKRFLRTPRGANYSIHRY